MPQTYWTRAFSRAKPAEESGPGFFANGAASLKDFANSVGAKLVMPSKTLLDKDRDCSDYRTTDVARTFERVRQQTPKLRRAK